MESESFQDWVARKARTRAIICDLDDTLCTEFDKPIAVACRVLVQLDRSIEVHYVTARPEAARAGTQKFLEECRLPGRRNLHLCPSWKSTREHKTDIMKRLAKEYAVIVSVGDAEEDLLASMAAGVPFLRVADHNLEEVWKEITALIGPPVEGPKPLFRD